MENLIVLKESELRSIIEDVIATRLEKPTREKPYYTMEEAVDYLNSNGFSIKKSTLYLHTSKGNIDFNRMGERKIAFTQEQLDQFIEKMKH